MSGQPPKATGNINVKYGVETELKINAIAARHGMHRNDWLRKLVEEAFEADEEGRPLFQKVEGPRVDTSLNVLAAQLGEIVIEWDRIRRENDRRDQHFLKAWNGGEEANRLAYEKLHARIIQFNSDTYGPFVMKVRDLRADMEAVSAKCEQAIDARLLPLDEKIEQIHKLASEPRVNKYVVLHKDWILSHWPLAIAAALMLGLGMIMGLVGPTFTDTMAVGQSGRLINSANRMCRLIERQYDAIDCNVPATVRKLGRGSGMKEIS